MKNLTKNAIILDNLSSPYVHQAIIILKNTQAVQHEKIIAEAERIVASYFNSELPSVRQAARAKNTGLKIAVILLSIALSFTLLLSFSR